MYLMLSGYIHMSEFSKLCVYVNVLMVVLLLYIKVKVKGFANSLRSTISKGRGWRSRIVGVYTKEKGTFKNKETFIIKRI